MKRVDLVLAFVACGDSAWKAEGFVVDKSGAPIEGASVTVVCPEQEQSLDSVKTIGTGRFEVGGRNAARAMGCALEVSKPGHHLRTARVLEACFRSKKTQNYDLPCGASEGKITLE